MSAYDLNDFSEININKHSINLLIMNILDNKDYNIIYILQKDSRKPLKNIAKDVGISKGLLHYRIKRLEKSGIIKGYLTLLNHFKLGYSLIELKISLQFTSDNKNEEIFNHFKNYHNTLSIASTKGKYDLIVTVIFNNNNDLFSFYEKTLSKFRFYFREINFFHIYEIYNNRSPLIPEEKRENVYGGDFAFGSNSDIQKVDNIDYQILQYLSKNAKISTVELAKKTSMSSITLVKKIKRLKDCGVIVGYTIDVDYDLIGHKLIILNISLKDHNKNNEIVRYLMRNPVVIEIRKTTSNFDMEIFLSVANFGHFDLFMDNLRKTFSNDLITYTYLFVAKYYVLNNLPKNTQFKN